MARNKPLADRVREGMEHFLAESPHGIRAQELGKSIQKRFDIENPLHSVVAQLSMTTDRHPEKFYKVKEKGKGTFYFLTEVAPRNNLFPPTDKEQKPKQKEEKFYPAFATYLERDKGDDQDTRLGECTTAIPLGGATFKRYWGTPDVIGVLRPLRTELVKFPDEIVSAEIKVSSLDRDIITAFGQACAYRLFSHKTYLVIPEAASASHIEKLCEIFGIGLAYFDPDEDPKPSIFTVKLLAQRHSPDMFYVNDVIQGALANRLYDK